MRSLTYELQIGVEAQELVDCRSREFRVCHVERVVSAGNREQFGAGNNGLEHVGDGRRPTAVREPTR